MMVSIIEAVLYSKPTAAEHQYLLRSSCHLLARGEGGGGVRKGLLGLNLCWVCAAGLSEHLPDYNPFCGQI